MISKAVTLCIISYLQDLEAFDDTDKNQNKNLIIIISPHVVRGRNVAQLIARQIIPLSKSDIIEKCVCKFFNNVERSSRFPVVQLLHWRYFCRSVAFKKYHMATCSDFSVAVFNHKVGEDNVDQPADSEYTSGKKPNQAGDNPAAIKTMNSQVS